MIQSKQIELTLYKKSDFVKPKYINIVGIIKYAALIWSST
jgi:hypothetical protein